MTRHWRSPARRPRAAAATVSLSLFALGCGAAPADAPPAGPPRVTRGGTLRVAVRTDPSSFNYYVRRDATNYLVSLLTHARLVRVNRVTQELEPWLAERWTRSDDGLRYTLTLRPNLTFADGHPFTAADVVFSFAAAYDAASGSTLSDSLEAGGQPLKVEALDPRTVVITFPVPFGPGLRLLDNLPILPRHKLEEAVKAKTFGNAWGLSTAVGELTGLGPFVLSEYASGQRLVFTRNERYFRTDAQGASLPYLDQVIVEIVPDQDAHLLRLEAGQIDLTRDEVRPEDYAPLKRAADEGRVQLLDLGVGVDADGLWFNLKPGAFAGDPRASWVQREELRRAISLAVDRTAFSDTVFLGAGVPVFGPITPANRKWHSDALPRTPHDPTEALALLASIGLRDRNGDGMLDDARGVPARFTLLTQKGQTAYERGAAVIREELRTIGLGVDVALLEGNALVERFLSGRAYDAVYLKLLTSDMDPALMPDFWFSSGSARVWNLGQKTPATEWEREIDQLMARQTAALEEGERKEIFDEVQRIFAEHLPIIYFVAPPVYVAASSRVLNLMPAIQRPQLLWAADTIAVSQ